MTEKWLYTAFLFLLSIWIAEAQNQISGPVKGLGIIYEISNDGRYVTGMTQTVSGAGYVWDTRAGGTVVNFGVRTYPYCVTNDRMVVGNFPDNIGGMSLVNAGYSTEGLVWTSLGPGLLDSPENNDDGPSARRVTPDGKLIVGYSRKDIVSRKIHVPYAWRRNEAGEWTGEEWAHPESAIQGYIIDISDDGRTGAGFVHNGIQRVAALWKSPAEYELPFSPNVYSEYLCISADGKYAGGSYADDLKGTIACIHDTESGEIIPIPEGFRVTAVSNNGFAVGIYRINGLDRAFIWNKKMGFMDFGDFILNYVPELSLLSTVQLQSVLTDKTRTFSVNAATPDGLTFAVCLPDGVSGTAYKITISSVTVYPYPRNLSADVPVQDRNKVILNWGAPHLEGETLTGYAVYRGTRLLATVDAETLTYTDLNLSPGYYNYTVKGVYDGGGYSNVSNTVRAVIINNYNLPLLENFDRLNLMSNYWTTETDRGEAPVGWNVYSDAGVEFGTGLCFQIKNFDGFADKTYSSALISKYLDGTEAEKIYLSFLVKPSYYLETGLTPDTLSIDVYDGVAWKTADKYTFKTVMEWKADIIDLSEIASGKLFRLRFRITGQNRTVSAKYIYFDDIVISTAAPAGDAVPQQLLAEKTAGNFRLAWQNPHTNLYALTYAGSSKRYSIGNEGLPFIAANRFDANDLALYRGMYLNSISAYINKKTFQDTIPTVLKLAVFADGERIIDQPASVFTSNAWNTFYLDNPVLIDGKTLTFGIEVVTHDVSEEPVGADGIRKAASGKGDLYSEDGGHTWKTLTDAQFVNNWCIVGNVSPEENAEEKRLSDVVGYNVYNNGVKLNDYLIFGQSFTTDSPGKYTVRAYSLASGISAESQEKVITGVIRPEEAETVRIYPNPVRDILYVRSEKPVESITVYDLTGSVRKQAGQGLTNLSVKDLNSGVYIVRIKTVAGESVRKIFISD